MLKKVLINSKKVPVPVPVRTLGEALDWVERTLVPAGHTITRVALNDHLLHDAFAPAHQDELLGDQTKLEIQIDSPSDLTVQTLDAMRNLASVVFSGLKVLAVHCWQARSQDKPAELDAVTTDLELILDLIDHVAGLIDASHPEAAAIQGISAMLKRTAAGIALAKSNSDWRACARLLLNRVEPLLRDLMSEAETVQIRVLTQAHTALAQGG